MMSYYRERDAQNAPRQERMDDLTETLVNQQVNTSSFNDQQARDTWDRYKATGIPAEDQMYADAANYDSKAARDTAAGQAATDIDTATAAAGDARRRQMARAGVNPADGRSLAIEQDAATQGALAKAGAMTAARTKVQDMGVMLRKDAANFARGMPGSAAQTFGVAGASGGQASGMAAAAMGTANANTALMGSAFTGAGNLNNSGASILQQQYNGQVQANSGGMGDLLSGVGGLATGLGAMGVKASMFSDKEMKENRAPVDQEAALEGIAKTPIESWNYKPGSPADDGGQQHVGGMAQDMEKNLGPQVSNGKTVDMISAIGTTMAAVQALNNKVDKLAGSRAASKGVKHG